MNSFIFINHTFCVFVRIASARRFLQIHKTYVLLSNNMGISMKNIRSANSSADQIGVITNFTVITNVFIKRFHYMYPN